MEYVIILIIPIIIITAIDFTKLLIILPPFMTGIAVVDEEND